VKDQPDQTRSFKWVTNFKVTANNVIALAYFRHLRKSYAA
jgi:hypothetical protein